MKKIIIITILLLILPITMAVNLGLPPEREILFEPFKEITLQYRTGNPGSQPLHIGVEVQAGTLQKYITTPSTSYTIQPFSDLNFQVKLSMPEELDQGFYGISVSVFEKSEKMEGMGGVTGVMDTVYIISPFDEGYPYGMLDVNQYQQAGTLIPYNMLVKNIGKTPLKGVRGTIKLKLNGKEVKESEFKNDAIVQPYATTRFSEKIDSTGLIPGYYEVESQLGEKTGMKTIALGRPTIKVFNVPVLKAAEQNTFNVTIKLENWASPIKDATVTFHVTNLMQVRKQVTLQPGENTVEFTDEAHEGKSGAYGGDVTIRALMINNVKGTFSTDVIGKVTKKGLGFTKTNETTETEEEPEEQQPITMEKIKETAKNEIFLILLLIASFAVFAFALGQYLARRKQQQY